MSYGFLAGPAPGGPLVQAEAALAAGNIPLVRALLATLPRDVDQLEAGDAERILRLRAAVQQYEQQHTRKQWLMGAGAVGGVLALAILARRVFGRRR